MWVLTQPTPNLHRGYLVQVVRQEYPRWLNYVIYGMMEIAVIGSDIQEVVGSAIAITLLSQGAVPVWAGCIITGCDTFTFLAVHFFIRAKILTAIGTERGKNTVTEATSTLVHPGCQDFILSK